MQAFEFVMVVISIIVALGVAELLAGVARIIRGELRLYWVHSLWVLTLLVLQFQYCWSLFDLSDKEAWVFLDLVRLVTAPILLFLVSSLLFPSRQSQGPRIESGASGEESALIELEQFYFSSRKPIFALLTVVILTLFFAVGTVFFVASFSYRLGESAF